MHCYSLKKSLVCPDRPRSQSGHQISEFVGAIAVLICGVTLPLINYSFIPVRLLMVQQAAGRKIHKLAMSEKLSDAQAAARDTSAASLLGAELPGVKIKSANLSLCISSTEQPGKNVTLSDPAGLRPEWLPGGANTPCDYTLALKIEADISPLVTIPVSGPKLPGVTSPVSSTIVESAHWENLGRDPASGKFFIAE